MWLETKCTINLNSLGYYSFLDIFERFPCHRSNILQGYTIDVHNTNTYPSQGSKIEIKLPAAIFQVEITCTVLSMLKFLSSLLYYILYGLVPKVTLGATV